jgi:hypothetical protein
MPAANSGPAGAPAGAADTRPRCRGGVLARREALDRGPSPGPLLSQPVATGATNRSGPCGEARGSEPVLLIDTTQQGINRIVAKPQPAGSAGATAHARSSAALSPTTPRRWSIDSAALGTAMVRPPAGCWPPTLTGSNLLADKRPQQHKRLATQTEPPRSVAGGWLRSDGTGHGLSCRGQVEPVSGFLGHSAVLSGDR